MSLSMCCCTASVICSLRGKGAKIPRGAHRKTKQTALPETCCFPQGRIVPLLDRAFSRLEPFGSLLRKAVLPLVSSSAGYNMMALLSETKSMASGNGIDGRALEGTTTDTPGSLVRQRQHRPADCYVSLWER